MNRKAKVLCKLSAGMFDNEYAVEIALYDGHKISLFADSALVTPNGSENSGYLEVCVVRDDSPATILLPSEAFETGSRWAQVGRENLEQDVNDLKQLRDS